MLQREHCPGCQGDRCPTLLELPYQSPWLAPWPESLAAELRDAHYRVRQCAGCGLYFQVAVCDPAEALRLYSPSGAPASPDAADRRAALPSLAHQAEEAMLLRLLFPDRTPKVLDFGMGEGRWARMVGAYDCQVWGTDISPQAATRAQDGGTRFLAPSEPLPPDFFDFINADQVFEHLADPVASIRALARSVRPGGLLKISTPGDGRMAAKLQRAREGGYDPATFKADFEALAPLYHVNLFARRSLLALGARAGLVPFQVPLGLSYATMTLFHSGRQWNRNLCHPFKRWRARGTWQFLQRPAVGG